MKHPIIGKLEGGRSLRLNVPALVETRLLIQAMSGGGKSWLLRLILEQTHGQIQHIVLDPEGEFPSLRERFDYILIGKGGDKAARVEQAAALARSMLELQANVICDLSELGRPDRRAFAARFLDGLLAVPIRQLKAPALIAIDEAHFFCPQRQGRQQAESSGPVSDLLARGRKRGLCALLATQRLAKLDKDAAAECGNYLIGRTRYPDDRARAAEMLGVSGAEGRRINEELGGLPAGTFYCIGEAFAPPDLGLVHVGAVRTQHPQLARGQLVAPVPPPSERVRAVLAQLDHIAEEQAEEEAEVVRLRARVTDLQRQLAARPVEQVGITEGQLSDYLTQRDLAWEGRLTKALGEVARYRRVLERVPALLREVGKAFDELPDGLPVIEPPAPWKVQERTREAAAERLRQPQVPSRRASTAPSDSDYRPRAGARRMLEALARFYPSGMSPGQLRLYARMRKSGTYDTYLAALKRAHIIESREGRFYLSETWRGAA